MIQELLGGTGGVYGGGERKITLNGNVLQSTPSHSPSSSTITTTNNINNTTTTTTTTAPPNADQTQNNLRCPRCDSSNTKFCYYNNYNLTQPRHFCKTCRRYWTKGGTLRNVPIGGGCRKNKNTSISTPIGKSSSVSGAKAAKIGAQYGYENHEFASNDHNMHESTNNPLLWASPQNSHILALLRSTQNFNPNPNQVVANNSITVKDEGSFGTNGCNMIMNESSQAVTTGAFNALTLGLDPFISQQVPSFWRNNNLQSPAQHQQPNGFNNIVGHHEVQNSGIQDLYERLRSSSNSYNYGSSDHQAASSSSVLESARAVAGGGGGGTGSAIGYWNNNSAYPTWAPSDLAATNGAYP